MHTSHSTGENRLLGYSLEDINKQRLAAGATKTVTPYNARTAEANAAMQNMTTQSTGTAITDPASASLQRLRQTQEYLTQNPTVDPTGSINTQALAGQKLAESYVAPRNLGDEQYYADQGKFLGDATRTYSNASEGFASEVAQTINNDPNSPTYGQRIQGGVDVASMSAIQQSAIDRLRSGGKTDEQIKTIMNDPVYMENIRTTMSNTGQGGTARQSAVLTPAQAQTILATSRNALERSKAQQFLDAEAEKGISRTIQVQVGVDKTGQPIYQTRTNPNFEKELEAKKQRMTQEQTNALKVQESMSKMKDFTSGIDTSAFEMTKNQITEAMGMIKNLSPDLQSAVLPTLLSLQESNNRNNESALQMKSTLPTDKEIEAQYGSFEAYINKMDEKMKKMNEENRQLQLDVAEYNRDALEIDKQIIEHDAYVAEQKQMQANIENEKRLRRQLGKLGINTDVQGLNFLQSEIQKGADAYNELKKGNNLVSLKAQLAIGQGYALDVRKAISDYDAKDLQITSQTAEALMKVKQSISTAKSDRDKELRSILKDANDKKDENAKEARTTIYNANIKMIELASEEKKYSRLLEKDAKADRKAEEKADALLSKEERTRIDTAKKEKQKAIGAVTDDLQGREWYKQFRETGTVLRSAIETMKDYKAGKVKETTMQEVATMAYAKLLDSNSVVRLEEFKRAVQGTGYEGKFQSVVDSINGGRGFPPGLIDGFMEVVENIYNEKKATALSEATPLLRRIRDFNTDYAESGIRIDPLSIFPTDILPVSDAAKDAADRMDDQTSVSSGLLNDLALAHQKHEGYGTKMAKTITENNNPGALRWHPSQARFGGEKDPRGFTKFPDYQSGFSALVADLSAKLNGSSKHINYDNNPTLLDYVAVYAPVTDRNNPPAYANAIVNELRSKGYDVNLDTPLSTLASIS